MIFRNSEHYYDPTAGQAIENVMRESEGLGDSELTGLHQTEPMQENWEDLANAIIIQQAEDYRKCRRILRRRNRRKRTPEKVRKEAANRIQEIELFFLSDWFCLLTKVDGGMILERLKKEEDEKDSKGLSAASLSA